MDAYDTDNAEKEHQLIILAWTESTGGANNAHNKILVEAMLTYFTIKRSTFVHRHMLFLQF